MLRATVVQVWGESFDDISLLDAVSSRNVKQLLTEAKDRLANELYEESVKHAAAGLYKLIDVAKPVLVGFSPRTGPGIMVGGQSVEQWQVDFDLYNSFVRMQDTTLVLALGMNIVQHFNFIQIAGTISDSMGFGLRRWGGKQDLDEDDARFVLNYCTTMAVQIESRIGPIVMHETTATESPTIS